MNRRKGARFNRGRIATVAGFSGGYVAPSVPVSSKAGAFWWADDITDAGTWAPRVDTLGVGSFAGVNTTLESTGWVTPEGNKPSVRLTRAAGSYLINDAIAAQLTADDAELEIVIWYQNISANNASALFAASSSSSTSPKRALLYTTGGWRWQQGATVSVFTHNATNLLQQMLRFKQVNTAPGTAASVWRNEETDPAGTLTMDVAAQAMDKFLVGAQWNGVSGPVNNLDGRIRGILIRKPGSAPYTADEGIELHNWGIGAYASAPLYSGSEQYLLLAAFGQSNAPCQGLGTGAVSGMPDAAAKMFVRALNNDADDPVAISALNLRPGASSYSSSMQWMPSGSFAMQHHFCGVGRGATNAGSDWGGQNGAGPVNSLQGLYSTSLYSECRRMIFATRARFGGSPIVQCIWQQGENDAAGGAVVAGQYAANWTAIKGYLRSLWTRMGITNVPIHVVQLNPNLTGGGIVLADLDTIRAAMVTDASGDANEYLIETNTITNIGPDNLHYLNASNSYGAIATGLVASVKASNPLL